MFVKAQFRVYKHAKVLLRRGLCYLVFIKNQHRKILLRKMNYLWKNGFLGLPRRIGFETHFLLMHPFINFYEVIIQIICWNMKSRKIEKIEVPSAKILRFLKKMLELLRKKKESWFFFNSLFLFHFIKLFPITYIQIQYW